MFGIIVLTAIRAGAVGGGIVGIAAAKGVSVVIKSAVKSFSKAAGAAVRRK